MKKLFLIALLTALVTPALAAPTLITFTAVFVHEDAYYPRIDVIEGFNIGVDLADTITGKIVGDPEFGLVTLIEWSIVEDNIQYSRSGIFQCLESMVTEGEIRVTVDLSQATGVTDDWMGLTMNDNGFTIADGGLKYSFRAHVLTVESSHLSSVVPAPGAILLGAMGTGLVGWLRRRRSL